LRAASPPKCDGRQALGALRWSQFADARCLNLPTHFRQRPRDPNLLRLAKIGALPDGDALGRSVSVLWGKPWSRSWRAVVTGALMSFSAMTCAAGFYQQVGLIRQALDATGALIPGSGWPARLMLCY
jgi:hypothetical protein